MKSLLSIVFLCVVWVWLSFPISAYAESSRWAQFTWENDIIAGNDAGYTNGLGISWGKNGLQSFDGALPSWLYQAIKNTQFAQADHRRRAVSFVLAQQMFTPKDIQARGLIKDDRPYVGLSLWGASLYSFNPRTADHWELILGVVGPWSGAESSQKLVHRALDSQQPKGWNNQIHNEPVAALRAQRLWRIHSGVVNHLQWDWVASLGVAVGNLKSEAGGLLMLRLGLGLADTWAAASTIAAREVNTFGDKSLTGWQTYWTLSAGYVANDITLNGNTFRHSHSVDLTHWRAATSVGVLHNWGRLGISFSYQMASDQFEQQTVSTRFGTLGFTYRY